MKPQWLADAPIHSINSGPAMAPVAGRHHAEREARSPHGDRGRRRRHELRRQRGAQRPHPAHARDVAGRSIRGSHHRVPVGRRAHQRVGRRQHRRGRRRWAADGRAGERRLGARPRLLRHRRHACDRHGCQRDPRLPRPASGWTRWASSTDVEAARQAIAEQIGAPLGLSTEAAAEAVIRVVTEQMVHAVEEVTVEQGVDPRSAVLVSGGGASGFNVVAIAGRLGCSKLIIPQTSAGLSASGGLLSDVLAEERRRPVHDLQRSSSANGSTRRWPRSPPAASRSSKTPASVVTRPPSSWSPKPATQGRCGRSRCRCERHSFAGPDDMTQLIEDFHTVHEEVFAVRDPDSTLEIVGWRARASSAVARRSRAGAGAVLRDRHRGHARRSTWAARAGNRCRWSARRKITEVRGPAVLELPGTSIVLHTDAIATRSASGTIVITPAHVCGRDRRGRRGVPCRLRAGSPTHRPTHLRPGGPGRALEPLHRDRAQHVQHADPHRALGDSESGPRFLVLRHHRPGRAVRDGREHPHPSAERARSDVSQHEGVPSGISTAATRSSTTRRTTATPTPRTCPSSCRCSTTTASIASRCSARPTWRTSATPSRRPTSRWRRNVYEEGAVILPCVKVQSNYTDIEDVIRMCRTRIRVPDKWWGDYLALLGSARVGEREVKELADGGRLGPAGRVRVGMARLQRGRMAEAISGCPTGRLTVQAEHDPFERAPDGVSLDRLGGDLRRRDRGRPARQSRLPAVRPEPDRGHRPLGGDARA